MYGDLATIYWELGLEKEAQNTQNEIKTKQNVSPSTLVATRSKYLCTIEYAIRDGKYYLQMRVNREQPSRKEGQPLEGAEEMKRKLDKCTLEINYETNDGKFVANTYNVTTPHEFDITSPPNLVRDTNKWYEVVIDIFADEQKQNKIGVHHQLVYAVPMAYHSMNPHQFLNI